MGVWKQMSSAGGSQGLVFRRVMQHMATTALGLWGPVCVPDLLVVLCVGCRSALDVAPFFDEPRRGRARCGSVPAAGYACPREVVAIAHGASAVRRRSDVTVIVYERGMVGPPADREHSLHGRWHGSDLQFDHNAELPPGRLSAHRLCECGFLMPTGGRGPVLPGATGGRREAASPEGAGGSA